ncbi:MAG TPA: hypothetical protein VMF52_16595 [Steroidobacteraceae bacterium]|nr:hypothetical protein [Steroidobacteraceae bacterium]
MNAKIEDFGRRLRDVLDEADKLLDAGAAHAADVPEAAREGLQQARAHLNSACESVGGRARAVNRAVHDHPWQAIVATGVVAFLIGLVAGRR